MVRSSAYLAMKTYAIVVAVAIALGSNVVARGAVLIVSSHCAHAYFFRTCSITLSLAGMISSCSLISSLISQPQTCSSCDSLITLCSRGMFAGKGLCSGLAALVLAGLGVWLIGLVVY